MTDAPMQHQPSSQFFAHLPPEKRAARKASMEKYGVQVLMVVDEVGNIIEDYTRRAIADEGGRDCPTVVVKTRKTDAEKLEHALKLNVLRRTGGPITWARAVQKVREARVGDV